MSMISATFLAFLGIALLLYYCVPKKYAWYILLAGSIAFYSTGGVYSLSVLIFVTLIHYGAAIMIERWKHDQRKLIRKLAFTMVIFLDAVCLFGLKNLRPWMSGVQWLLPVGISFYMLEAYSYLMDVNWKRFPAEKNPLRLLLFLSFFPCVIQGPICNYREMKSQLFEGHSLRWEDVKRGSIRILLGMAKKLVIADRAAVAVETLTGNTMEYGGGAVLLVMLFYSVQLYGDFTGGIDMAIGAARCFGIVLPENFDCPYFAISIKDYWRRWHVTMGRWFSNYVFYPLSTSEFMGMVRKRIKNHLGNQAARRLTVFITTGVTWLLIGAWHGRGSATICWGFLNFLFLMVCDKLETRRKQKRKASDSTGASPWIVALKVMGTFLLMSALRLFDCYESAGETLMMLGGMVVSLIQMLFGIQSPLEMGWAYEKVLPTLGLDGWDYGILGVGIVVFFLFQGIQKKTLEDGTATGADRLWSWYHRKPWLVRYLLVLGLFLAVLFMGSYGIAYVPKDFIYHSY